VVNRPILGSQARAFRYNNHPSSRSGSSTSNTSNNNEAACHTKD
jgi:hypothetical protein